MTDDEWLEILRTDPKWQQIRAGLAEILTDDLTDYVGTGISCTEYREVDGFGPAPAKFKSVPWKNPISRPEIRVREEDTNLDLLALHIIGSWQKTCF
jgi:hypothetical protein